MYGRKIFRPYFFIAPPRTDNSRIVSSTSFNKQTVGANLVFALFLFPPYATSTIKRLHDSTIQRDLCSAQTDRPTRRDGHPLVRM